LFNQVVKDQWEGLASRSAREAHPAREALPFFVFYWSQIQGRWSQAITGLSFAIISAAPKALPKGKRGKWWKQVAICICESGDLKTFNGGS
jgi:hypothetical protein